MLKYILLRVLFLFITIFVVMTFLYFTLNMVQLHNFGPRPRFTFWENLVYNFDGYIAYIKAIFTEWDFGETQYRKDVWEEFLYRAPITLKIAFVTLGVYVILGLFLGFISAVKEHTMIDHVIGFVTMIFSSIPPFVLMFPLVVVLGFRLEWLPHKFPSTTDPVGKQMLGYVIPVIALSGPAIAQLSRLLRGELVEAKSSDYMLLARAKGLSNKRAFYSHALRNSMVPILPEIPALFIVVLMNSFFIESIYQLNGMANWFLNSMRRPFGDTGYIYIHAPNALIISLFYTVVIMVALLIVDVLFVIVDPRIKMGKKYN